MKHIGSYVVTSILSASIGYILSRCMSKDEELKNNISTQTSPFEQEALGFVNWYRLNGREQISHEVLIQNLDILEAKAIASNRLIATKTKNP